MSVIDILLDSTPYILIIDWINYHKISLELKLYTLMKKYINYRTDNKSFDLIYDSNLLSNKKIESSESDDTNSSFDILK